MIFKIVRLKKETEEYKALGLNKDSLGLIVSEKESQCVTLFFNNSNQGDFLVRLINKSDLAETDSNLPESLCLELEKYILNNFYNFTNKDAFNNNPFNECDHVELIVEKEKYVKYGLHKGDTGVIASNKAVKNKILVDFGIETEDSDGFVLVDFKDIKVIK